MNSTRLAIVLSMFAMAFAAVAQTTTPLRDCPDCPDLMVIPAGSFTMGSLTGSEEEANTPRRTVSVNAFAIGKYEITQAQWFSIMGTRPGMFKGDDLPVEQVTWKQALEFTRKLSEKTGQAYRLPTEAEWEYAARADSQTDYYFGTDQMQVTDHSWFDENSDETTNPVGQKPANNYGLYDMYGNVWEWTMDCWNTSYEGAPVDGSAWTSGDCSMRVARGGSWYNKLKSIKSTARARYSSEIRYNSRGGGLRVVRELPSN